MGPDPTGEWQMRYGQAFEEVCLLKMEIDSFFWESFCFLRLSGSRVVSETGHAA